MATKAYSVGNTPPFISWTIVRGDSAAFKVYATDDAKVALDISLWNIKMEIKRPNVTPTTIGTITDNATLKVTLFPEPTVNDATGEFTVAIYPEDSNILETGDIFDIELSEIDGDRVWTVAQGYVIILEDVTNSYVAP